MGPRGVSLEEGILIFDDKAPRDLMDLKIFADTIPEDMIHTIVIEEE